MEGIIMFVLFVFDGYYPGGGMNDYVGAFATVPLADAAFAAELQKKHWDYGQIVEIRPDGLVTILETRPERNANGQLVHNWEEVKP